MNRNICQKVMYVETFPDKISKIFEDMTEYYAFIQKRYDEIARMLDIYNPLSKHTYKDWKHQRFRLNNDGTPRKYYGANHLQTKASREKQKVKWQEYKERQRNDARMRREQKVRLDQEAYDKAIDILLKHGIDLNRLDIRIKR